VSVNIIEGTPCYGSHVRIVDFNVPCPSIADFSYDADMGVLRTPVNAGYARQRRRYKTQPRTYQLTWRLTTEQLNSWEIFAQKYGYNWFFLPMTTGQSPFWFPAEHPVRFISNYSVSLETRDIWAVTVEAEQYRIDYSCFVELFCDEMRRCVDKADFPEWGPVLAPVIPELDYSSIVEGWGTVSDWRLCDIACGVELAPIPVLPPPTELPQFDYDKFVALWGDVYSWGGF